MTPAEIKEYNQEQADLEYEDKLLYLIQERQQQQRG